jgi:UDP-N-acetylglucosamine--N-acetylmuramyl-(pentapeptide) pyrophosphoryl-undecaprenol N-acetylglucosamine transferase
VNQFAAATTTKPRLLIAASGTGGHLFPAIAVAECLTDYDIEWLGVPGRMETQLIPEYYPLNIVNVGGFQKKSFGHILSVLTRFIQSICQTRQLLKQGKFAGVFTTGGYISAPAIIAAHTLGLPVVLHESNALPGKVTRWFAPWCNTVLVGFPAAQDHLPKGTIQYAGTPVRKQFMQQLQGSLTDLAIPDDVPLIAIVGGSQGAVAINQVVRACAPAWIAAGAWVLHQTGNNDPDVDQYQHPHYITLPFYAKIAALFQRADLVISRAGAATLTELAMTQTPSILIPYPFAAEDHQTFNAKVFVQAAAAEMIRQPDLTVASLRDRVLALIHNPEQLAQMAQHVSALAVPDSAEQVAQIMRDHLIVKRQTRS